jgi:uncharacterized protein
MEESMRRRNLLAAPLTTLLALTLAFAVPSQAADGKKARILYITTTAGFHHDSCEHSVPIIKKMGEESGLFEITASDKTDLITPEGLKDFDAIFFSNTTGAMAQFPLSEPNREALIQAIKDGKGFIGAHAAADTFNDWAPYYEMIGGTFNGHPWHEEVKINIEDPASPAGAPCPSPWVITDEIYTYKNWSRDKIHVVMSLDSSSVKGKGNRPDNDYALAWCKTYGKGNVFYTALGHRKEVWDNPLYQAHLLGGIKWVLGVDRPEIRPGHPKVESTSWVRIFDGEHLNFGTDWETSDDAQKTHKHWTVQPGGILQGAKAEGTPENSHLYYIKKKFKNFEYRADVCINKTGNSGMYFRCQDSNKGTDGKWKNWPNGYEAQVDNYHTDEKRSGTFYPAPSVSSEDLKRLTGYDPDKDDGNFWFNEHVIAIDGRVVIKLNGKVATVMPDTSKLRGEKGHWSEGYFAYQYHDPKTIVKFKNIEVRELP